MSPENLLKGAYYALEQCGLKATITMMWSMHRIIIKIFPRFRA
jgi:hypothetical protein